MNTLQRNESWYASRCGRLTASRAAVLFYKLKTGGRPKAYFDLLDEICVERLTGKPAVHHVNEAMQWGIDHEDDAIAEYEERTGRLVVPVGFVCHPEIENLGASPDGLVEDDGLIEVKCPTTLTQIERVRAGEIPRDYQIQMQVQLLCTGRRWCDFVSYDPRLAGEWAPARFFLRRYRPLPAELAATRAELVSCLAAIDERMAGYRAAVNNMREAA